MSKITIYTDGSSRGNPGPGGFAAIIIDQREVNEIGGFDRETTNNRMELMACIKALEFVSDKGGDQVTIFCDSEYVVKGITLWIKGWIANKWKNSQKKPVMNRDLWEKLLEVSAGKKIEWKHVLGHVGNKGNERCDEIATSFADQTNIDLYKGPVAGYKLL